jgi:hypothetical protein
MRFSSHVAVAVMIGCLSGCTAATQRSGGAANPQRAADELLAADRTYAAASAGTDVVTGLSSIFAPDASGPLPGRQLAMGSDSLVRALRSNPENATSRIVWAPMGVGISGDGTHGYTYGFMTMTPPGKPGVPMKYLAYWVKGPSGWKVEAYKRVPRAAGDSVDGPRVRLIPSRSLAPNSASIEAYRKSLDAAERAFSDDAQKVGLGQAFRNFGAPEAINMGGPDVKTFVYGPEAIAQAVSDGANGPPSPVTWAPEKVIVAPSGDMGVTIGWITSNDAPAAGQQRARFPFFTVWRRATLSSPWRYVAE